MAHIALTIAGSDSGGGAGIQADLKAMSALGVYGASVITAITAQNTQAVTAVHGVPLDVIAAQIDAVLSDLDVRAVKIGTYIGYGMAAGAAAGLWARRDQLRLARLTPLALLSLVPLLWIKAQVTRDTLQTGEWQFTNLAGYWADFLMPVVLFVLCMCLWRLSWPPILSRLAPYSFGIYLCHPLFLDLAEILLRDSDASPITQVGIKIAMALPGAALLTWALSRSISLGWSVGLGPLPWRPRLVESRSG